MFVWSGVLPSVLARQFKVAKNSKPDLLGFDYPPEAMSVNLTYRRRTYGHTNSTV